MVSVSKLVGLYMGGLIFGGAYIRRFTVLYLVITIIMNDLLFIADGYKTKGYTISSIV